MLLVALVAGLSVASHYTDQFLRRQMEARLNQHLKGYTVRIPGLHLHLLGFALTLKELRISQEQHPNPPVAYFPELQASVQWRELVRARLVAAMVFERPALYVNRRQLSAEADDKVALKDKGWQRALESIYPLKINSLTVSDGKLTYVDDDPKRPLKIEHLYLTADNIRNIQSPDHVYPSGVYLEATIFETGRVRVNGNANFLAEPYAGVDADIDLEHIELNALDPVAAHANLRLTNGIVGAFGHVEYAPGTQVAHLKKLTIHGVEVEYVHRPETATAEAERIETAKEVAKDLSNEPTTLVRVDELVIDSSLLGYVNQAVDPGYRLFLSDAAVKINDFSSRESKQPATVLVKGQFMGTGRSILTSTFRPVQKKPEFDLTLQIEETELSTMNDLFRSYGNFDVNSGRFAVYSELSAKDGELHGYIKPLFTEMDVYDRRQDRDKSLGKQLYEGLVGGVAGLLRNPDENVATQVDISGRIDEPDVSTWDAVLRLIQNAFFKTIVPRFEEGVRQSPPS